MSGALALPGGARGWRWLAPAFVVLGLMDLLPILWSTGMSFFRFHANRPHTPPAFLGLRNYVGLLTDAGVWQRVVNTGELMAGSVLAQLLVGAALAWLFHRPFPGRRPILMLVLTPMLLSTVFIGTFFRLFILPPFGLVYWIATEATGQAFNPLVSPAAALACLIVADAWQWSPFVMLMLLAGLAGVPKELCEAAAIDRAAPWRRFRTVVFPSLRGVLLLAVLFRTIASFNAFELIFTITNGGPGISTESLATAVYGTAFVLFDTGRASALANFSACVIIVLVSLYVQAIRQRSRAAGERAE